MMEEKRNEEIRKAAALRYDKKIDRAPRVVASGKGHIAEKIINEAKKAGVPILEDPALVAVLLGVGLGEEIPEEAYLAVARILVFLHNVDIGEEGKIHGQNAQ